jgi:hypothetical protein
VTRPHFTAEVDVRFTIFYSLSNNQQNAHQCSPMSSYLFMDACTNLSWYYRRVSSDKLSIAVNEDGIVRLSRDRPLSYWLSLSAFKRTTLAAVTMWNLQSVDSSSIFLRPYTWTIVEISISYHLNTGQRLTISIVQNYSFIHLYPNKNILHGKHFVHAWVLIRVYNSWSPDKLICGMNEVFCIDVFTINTNIWPFIQQVL